MNLKTSKENVVIMRRHADCCAKLSDAFDELAAIAGLANESFAQQNAEAQSVHYLKCAVAAESSANNMEAAMAVITSGMTG